ncbi:MAG: T9SS type A sorting domain-containing protein, partial [Vicingaceae bacterium]|nr:T9SS type A sorting domain-containing protein [Vicingaceae bacterium]
TKKLITDIKLIDKVYPNPFVDFINIELNEPAPYVFKVFDLNGQLVKITKLNTKAIKINLPNLKSGQYILKVSNTNEELETIRLIKK